jgi:drug/metabolite transporter (DMT)-like permease
MTFTLRSTRCNGYSRRVTATAIVLVVCASALHALWNLCAKRGDHKLVFLWASAVAGSVLLVVPVALIATPPAWTPVLAVRVIAASILRASYFVALTAAYSRGDLSLVYPLARGIAPVLVPVLAVALLGEALSLRAAIGVAAIAIGVYITHLELLAFRQILSPFRSLGAAYARYAVLTVYSPRPIRCWTSRIWRPRSIRSGTPTSPSRWPGSC